METLLLPVSFSADIPEGLPPQDAPQGFGNFAEVLEKQFFKEGNPLPEDPQISSGDPASSAMANSFLAAIWVPYRTAFLQEKPTTDQGLTTPAPKEESPTPSLIDLSPLFIIPQPSPGSETGVGAVSLNEEKAGPFPKETVSPPVTQNLEKGPPPPPVFFPWEKGETNQETSPGAKEILGNPGQKFYPTSPSISSAGQDPIRTSQEIPIPPDSSASQTSLEDPIRRELTGNKEMAWGAEGQRVHSADSSIPPSSSEETLPGESTKKIDMPLEGGKKIVLSSDSPIPPVSSEEPLRKDLPGKIELSLREGKNSIRPSAPQEMNGSESTAVQESNDFLDPSQPSLKKEVPPRIGEKQIFKRPEPPYGVAKVTQDGKSTQNLEERDPLIGTQPFIPESVERELGVHFSEKTGKGQEKALWAGADVRPLPDKEIQNTPHFFGALTDPLNRKVENGGEIKESFPAFSPRPEPSEVIEQVGQRVQWLIRNNEERIRITLDPPELGQVFLEIDRHKEHIKTVLWTDNPATKASLETSQGEIQRIIESEGFKLEKFDVFVQQDPGWFQGRKENPRKPNTWEGKTAAEERAPSANSMESIPGRTPASHLGSRYLDLFV